LRSTFCEAGAAAPAITGTRQHHAPDGGVEPALFVSNVT